LAALALYPIVWLLLLPFRIVGIAVEGVLQPGLGPDHPSGPPAARCGVILKPLP